MADIDLFKQVNDSAGHECGDRLLQTAAALFLRECRDTDYVCRWGGEEFMFLFIDTDLAKASVIAERIRAAFESVSYECAGTERRTISIGLTQSGPDVPVDRLIKRADDLLYEAKRTGRNRVVARG
jgi:diguanylate cyclase (GGDEF)-like protein